MTQSNTNEIESVVKVSLTWNSIIKVIVVVTALFFLIRFHDIAFIFFFSYILSTAAQYVGVRMEKKGARFGLGVVGFYSIMIGVSVLTFVLIIPAMVNEISNLYIAIPKLLDRLENIISNLGFNVIAQQIEHLSLQGMFGTFYQAGINIFRPIFSEVGALILALVSSIYLTVQRDSVEKTLLGSRFVPFLNSEGDMKNFKYTVGRWSFGQIVIGFSMSILTAVIFFIMGIEYGMLFSVILGISEVVPYLGSAVTGVFVFVLIFLQNPVFAIVFIVYYFTLQQLKGLIINQLVHKELGMPHPTIIIFGAGVGYLLSGILGLLVFVPVLVGFHHVLRLRNKRERESEEFIQEEKV